jgi:hypothetical protein
VADAKAMKLLAERVPVLAFVNNHFAGYSHDTIEKLIAALNDGGAAKEEPW